MLIDLEEGKEPPYSTLYNLSIIEIDILKKYLYNYLSYRQIQYSRSPTRVPILFIKKKDSSLRLYIDYRGLNIVTIKN